MPQNRPVRRIGRLLAQADVEIDGSRPWDIHVHEPALFARLLRQGSLGLGESYVDGWWDCERLDELFCRVLQADLVTKVSTWREIPALLQSLLVNLQKPSRAFIVGVRHYDIGNDLYQRMLDRRMIYSCAWWKDAETLDEAQEAKLEMTCRKLGLEPGMRLLDIGCGWGGMAAFAAERYGVEVVGITVSRQQLHTARERCRGLPVEIRLEDYRALEGRFDRIVSIGMFEHVGWRNYRTFFRVVRRCLADDGLFLLHTIGGNRSIRRGDPWVVRYIFPNSMLPSARQISEAAEGLFLLEDWHSFGPHYDRTLMAWFANFEEAWKDLEPRYGERFRRMWIYYLMAFAGAFRARKNQVWQVLLSTGRGEASLTRDGSRLPPSLNSRE